MKLVCENDNRMFDPSKFIGVPRDTSPDQEAKYIEKVKQLKASFDKKREKENK